jgi:hypothetical protein
MDEKRNVHSSCINGHVYPMAWLSALFAVEGPTRRGLEETPAGRDACRERRL